MHKLIVTSATYRQSSRMTPEHRARDSDNRLYAAVEPIPDVVAHSSRLGTRVRRTCSIRGSAARRSILISPMRSGRPSRSPRNATSPIPLPRAATFIAAVSTHSGAAPSARPTCSTRRIGRRAACDRPRPARRCTLSQRSTTPPGSRPPRARSNEHESDGQISTPGSLTRFAGCCVASQPIVTWRYCAAPTSNRPRFSRPTSRVRRRSRAWARPGETNHSTSPSTPRLSAVCLAIFNLDEALTQGMRRPGRSNDLKWGSLNNE